MLHRDAVHEAREPKRKMREVERSTLDALRRLEQRDLLVTNDAPDQIHRELVVPRGHRRVRREHTSAPHRLDVGFVELERLSPVELPIQETQREERRMSLVEVIDARVAVESAKELRATHAE